MDVKDSKWIIYGTGRSGVCAANLLISRGADVLMYDENVNVNTEEVKAKITEGEIEIIAGEFPVNLLSDYRFLLVSPGVPVDTPVFDEIRNAGCKVVSEIELAYLLGKGTVYAITGTNGKTTTTSLLGKIMQDYSGNAYTVGNIGVPYTGIANESNDESKIVLEVSSFQLETIEVFRPHVSAILNITEDHLNRHHTMEEYIRVKERITENQTYDDFCILNYEDEVLRSFGEEIKDKVKVVFFSSANKLDDGIYLDGRNIVAGFKDDEVILNVDDLNIIGVHNFENVMAAVAMALCAGVPTDSIVKSCKEFVAVPHRIEPCGEVRGVRYYNDSKGTNPDAAIKAIEAMDRPTLLIGGGYDKQSDFRPWIKAFGGKVKYLVLEGATKEKIKEAALAENFPEDHIVMKETMIDALAFCMENAVPGDAVLLSPACASWGEFRDFEQRGDVFKEYVKTH